MPSGSLPTYKYVPPFRPGSEAQLRTCSSRRARLWAGGTYFRARDPGSSGNLCTVEAFAYSPSEAYCRITNTGLLYSENVTGAECSVDLLEYESKVSGEFQDLYELYDLDTDTPRARKYSISLRISFARQEGQPFTLPAPEELGLFTFGKLFVSGKLSVQLTKKSSPYASGDRIFVAPRTRIFSLAPLTVTPPATPEEPAPVSVTGYDIADLRSKVNSANIWVEMKERTPAPAAPEGGGPAPTPTSYIDAQDKLQDALVLTAFAVSNLENGDGLPDNPNRERTGPSRSLCFVNYGEKPDGSLGEHNTVYEWVGDSASAGSWKSY